MPTQPPCETPVRMAKTAASRSIQVVVNSIQGQAERNVLTAGKLKDEQASKRCRLP
jgi:hypothetical protein